jgi:release factor glutamine methyltransferase
VDTISTIRLHFLKQLSHLYTPSEIDIILKELIEFNSGIQNPSILHLKDKEITVVEKDLYETQLKDLLAHKPIQYITGIAHFYYKKFLVSPAVLIPRPETEELVNIIIKENQNRKDLKIIDVCSGSGCIAISLAAHLSESKVDALEKYDEAIQILHQNNQKHFSKLSSIIHEDIFTWDPEKKYDIIVSNPPYITATEAKDILPNVLNYEPLHALFVKSDPLEFYMRIIDLAILHLCDQGKLYFECNQEYTEQICIYARNKGFLATPMKDIHGLWRFAILTME